MEQRAELLQATSRTRGRDVYVASPAVLAWTPQDMLESLAALAARGDTVHLLDAGLVLTPTSGAAELHQVVVAFGRAREPTRVGRSGAEVSGARRAAASLAAVEKVRARWPLPSSEHPTAALIAEAGIARGTIEKLLGKRPEVQRRHAAAVKRRKKP